MNDRRLESPQWIPHLHLDGMGTPKTEESVEDFHVCAAKKLIELDEASFLSQESEIPAHILGFIVIR